MSGEHFQLKVATIRWKMSVLNTNSLNTIDASKNLVNETNLNDTTKISENRVFNENSKPKPTTTNTTTAALITTTTMPAATNPMNATVTVLNSNAPFPPSEQCSDSEEDFDRTTRNLGAPHKWIFNYKDVSHTIKRHTQFNELCSIVLRYRDRHKHTHTGRKNEKPKPL